MGPKVLCKVEFCEGWVTGYSHSLAHGHRDTPPTSSKTEAALMGQLSPGRARQASSFWPGTPMRLDQNPQLMGDC